MAPGSPFLELRTIGTGSEATTDEPRSFDFEVETKSTWSIGRVGCDITLCGNSTSRKHAYIHHEVDGSWYIEDLKSAHGTYLNGQRLQGHVKTRWRSNQIVTFGCPRFLQQMVSEKDRNKAGCDEAKLRICVTDKALEVLLKVPEAPEIPAYNTAWHAGWMLEQPNMLLASSALDWQTTMVEPAFIESCNSDVSSVTSTAPSEKVPVGAVAKVTICGMPKKLLTNEAFEAVLQQSNVRALDFSFSVEAGQHKALVHFADILSAHWCARHFNGFCCTLAETVTAKVSMVTGLEQPQRSHKAYPLPEPLFIPVHEDALTDKARGDEGMTRDCQPELVLCSSDDYDEPITSLARKVQNAAEILLGCKPHVTTSNSDGGSSTEIPDSPRDEETPHYADDSAVASVEETAVGA